VLVTPPSKPPPLLPPDDDLVDVEPELERSLSKPLAEADAAAFVIETIDAVIGVIAPPFLSSPKTSPSREALPFLARC